MRFIYLILMMVSLSAFSAVKINEISNYNFITKKEANFKFKDETKYRVFYFLSPSCPCSKSHFKHLNMLVEKFPDYEFVGFMSDYKATKEKIHKYIDDKNLTLPIFHDHDLKFADQFKAIKTPHVFVLDQKGEIVFHGGVTNSRIEERAKKHYLLAALNELSEGKEVSKPYARTLGCAIIRK